MRTDWYKPVMAAAGAPLRRETFNFAIRRGGPFFMPVDPATYVRGLLPELNAADEAYLSSRGLGPTEAYREALRGPVEVVGIPAGTWFGDREIALTVTGPSALVSYLEAQVIWLRFRIQVATLALLEPSRLQARLGTVTCDREREIVQESLAAAGVAPSFSIDVDPEGYASHIRARACKLLKLVGDPSRVFEAGMRAASCAEQHLIAVQACKEAGFVATSNVEAARALGMQAVGTTGHEHTQRHGTDYEAFTAVRDRVSGEVTFLLDTYATRSCGLPSALRVMQEAPQRSCSIRFDSESTMEGDYLLGVHALREHQLEAPINLGGGFDLVRTRRFESLREMVGWPAPMQRYMYGQYLVEPHVPLPTRGEIGAVYKLSCSGQRATMKFSDNAEKSSAPGRPVTWRLISPGRADRGGRPIGIIGQLGEQPPADYFVLSEGRPMPLAPEMLEGARAAWSPETEALREELERNRLEQITDTTRRANEK